MNQPALKTWSLNTSDESIALLAALAARFTVEPAEQKESTMTFLDDFDAHLWRANYLLYRDDKYHLRLIDEAGKNQVISALPDAKFWWQLGECPAQNAVKNLIGLRALIPLISLQMCEQHIALRNQDQKLVVRVCIRSITISGQTKHYLAMTALRGYTKDFAAATAIIAQFSNTESYAFDLKQILHEQAIFAVTREKVSLPSLVDNMPTEQAVRVMAVAILQQASIHVPGVIADTDTEFLHQFRVSFRKLRSLISLLQKALPREMLTILKPKLSAIAGATNKLRDLDVFLLEQNYYRSLLPSNFSDGLTELYTLIEQQRAQEKNTVAHYFSSAHYAQDMEICATELSAPVVLQTPAAAKPLLTIIKKLLLARYQKMRAMAALIQSNTPDEEVHELRIEFKKLRYLIEFFSSLFPSKRINKLEGEMKKIQAILGAFNDFSVQIEFLNTYVDDSKIEMSKALSGLIAILHQKKIAERNKVDAALLNFFTLEMNNEIDILFGAVTPGASQ